VVSALSSAARPVSKRSAKVANLAASHNNLLYLIEWVVEGGQVTLHQFGAASQQERTYYQNASEALRRVAPADRQHVEQLVTLLIDGKLERCEVEFRLIEASGEERWVYGKGVLQHQPNEVAKVVGLITDIESRDRISHVPDLTHPFSNANALPVGVIQLNLSTGNIKLATQTACQILDMPPYGTHHEFPDMDTADWVSVWEALRKQKPVLSQPLRLPSLNRWVLVSGCGQENNQATVVLQDITALKEENVALQKVNAELDNFVYHASHDLRAPLRAILGSLDLIKTTNQPGEREKCVELIEGSINRLDIFITDLLSISRQQRRENLLTRINLMVEVEHAVAAAYHVGNTRNLEVVTKISQPHPLVADLTRVRMVLNNLISNAIKYRRYDVSPSYIRIEVWVTTKRVHLKVADNGEGIAEHHQDRIFDMFYRASARSEGSGLGLYIVKDVIQKLGGTISVRSNPNQGTTFSASFPNRFGQVNDTA
jgi:signal transduction histidine kinase